MFAVRVPSVWSPKAIWFWQLFRWPNDRNVTRRNCWVDFCIQTQLFFSHGVLGLRNLLRALKQCSTPLVGWCDPVGESLLPSDKQTCRKSPNFSWVNLNYFDWAMQVRKLLTSPEGISHHFKGQFCSEGRWCLHALGALKRATWREMMSRRCPHGIFTHPKIVHKLWINEKTTKK
jgi:hypothetical protein